MTVIKMRQEQYEEHEDKRTENGEVTRETQKNNTVRLSRRQKRGLSGDRRANQQGSILVEGGRLREQNSA